MMSKIGSIVLLLMAVAINTPQAKIIFPTVKELEIAFHLYDGAQLGKDVQASDGQIFHTYYVKAKDVGNGLYEVTVRLNK
jgi:hypothetical protein